MCASVFVARGDQKRVMDPLELDLGKVVKPAYWCWGPNFCPLEEQQMLLTLEPSLEPQNTVSVGLHTNLNVTLQVHQSHGCTSI